jgi:hypothetical protein
MNGLDGLKFVFGCCLAFMDGGEDGIFMPALGWFA